MSSKEEFWFKSLEDLFLPRKKSISHLLQLLFMCKKIPGLFIFHLWCCFDPFGKLGVRPKQVVLISKKNFIEVKVLYLFNFWIVGGIFWKNQDEKMRFLFEKKIHPHQLLSSKLKRYETGFVLHDGTPSIIC